MINPTAEEIVRTIQLMTMFDDSEDPTIDRMYRFTHIIEGNSCKNRHEDWVKEFRAYQKYFENINKAPADPTKELLDLRKLLE